MTDSEIETLCEDIDRYHEELGGGATPEEAAQSAAAQATASVVRRLTRLRWDRWTDEDRETYREYIEGMGR